MKKEQVFIKEDTQENWEKAVNFIPKLNEIIIYSGIGKKIGDGKTLVNNLPFISVKKYIIKKNILYINN